ncbi:YALIA101S03e05490g1_1 [Yarrowia lipolytica]|uniref:Uncharacterized protein n=1 Tax=Yarrowia lipolytica TaxID=4952 RepID=A0A1H6PWA8_YARLL|nr:hypothetical protein YALI1_F34095g [Yarrowia lipolytica]QNP99443.1 Cytochrome c oxidase polypeptide 5 [Yarrowia lipolytica]SEI32900.1 YALIA101S03e05490g1_1 [Yarrowia lipolytica]VBB82398.1 Conserved hypothetical protein [Yarrowia lipolytica]
MLRQSRRLFCTSQRVLKKRESPLQTAFGNDDPYDDGFFHIGGNNYKVKNPIKPSTLNIPKRWPKMATDEQQDVVDYLEDQMRGDWKIMTPEEKQAAYYIYFGPWGPREPNQDPDRGMRLLTRSILWMAVGFAFYTAANQYIEFSEESDSASKK